MLEKLKKKRFQQKYSVFSLKYIENLSHRIEIMIIASFHSVELKNPKSLHLILLKMLLNILINFKANKVLSNMFQNVNERLIGLFNYLLK